jgi:transposase
MSNEDLLRVYSEGIESVVSLVKGLTQEINSQTQKIDNQTEEIQSLREENKKLAQRVEALENQKHTNSNNSSKPPSTDGFNKRTKNLRGKSNKKPGGQVGHKGT